MSDASRRDRSSDRADAQTPGGAGGADRDFLEDASDNHWFNRADMVDQTFCIGRFGATAGEVGLLQPEVSNLVMVLKAKLVIDMFEQPHTREWIGLVHFIANLR